MEPEVFYYIPRYKIVQKSENDGKIAIEKDEISDMANIYMIFI